MYQFAKVRKFWLINIGTMSPTISSHLNICFCLDSALSGTALSQTESSLGQFHHLYLQYCIIYVPAMQNAVYLQYYSVLYI